MDEALTDEEMRYLRALRLFYEAQGRDDLAKNLDEAAPGIQRLSISMYHQWLDHPDSFGIAWKWTLRLLPVIKVYVRFKEKVTNIFRR